MKSIIFFTMLFTTTITCYCQNVDSVKQVILDDTTSALNKKIYVIDINRGGINPSFGYLQSLNKTTLSVTSSPLVYGSSTDRKLFLYNTINNIRIHRKGLRGQGAFIGALGGLVLGGIIGAVTYSKPQNNSLSEGWFSTTSFDFGIGLNILAGSSLGLLLGLPIGILSGSSVKKYSIGKNQQAFEDMRSQLIDVYGIKNPVNQHDK